MRVPIGTPHILRGSLRPSYTTSGLRRVPTDTPRHPAQRPAEGASRRFTAVLVKKCGTLREKSRRSSRCLGSFFPKSQFTSPEESAQASRRVSSSLYWCCRKPILVLAQAYIGVGVSLYWSASGAKRPPSRHKGRKRHPHLRCEVTKSAPQDEGITAIKARWRMPWGAGDGRAGRTGWVRTCGGVRGSQGPSGYSGVPIGTLTLACLIRGLQTPGYSCGAASPLIPSTYPRTHASHARTA